MALTPAQVQFIVNTEPYRTQLAQVVQQLARHADEIVRLDRVIKRLKAARVHTMYRQKKRGKW
jgi:hypothetical protein